MTTPPDAPSPLLSPLDTAKLPALWPPDYGADPTSLEPPETNVPDAEHSTAWGGYVTSNDLPVAFRHSGWSRIRSLVRAAMETNRCRPRQLARFDLCGSDPWIAVDPNDPTRFALLADRCHSRWCVPCARERGRTIAANLQLKLGSDPVRFLTLTLKENDQPLRAHLDRLITCFRKLRSTRLWKTAVDGGAAVLEIKRRWKRESWNVHLHVLFHGTFIAQRVLAALWWKITGDSYIVDIRMLRNGKDAAGYVAKYVSKPFSATLVNKPDALAELLSALAGRRLVLTFGTWRGFRLTEKIDATDWKSLCPLPIMYERAEAGDQNALTIIRALETVCPDARFLAGRSPPNETPTTTTATP